MIAHVRYFCNLNTRKNNQSNRPTGKKKTTPSMHMSGKWGNSLFTPSKDSVLQAAEWITAPAINNKSAIGTRIQRGIRRIGADEAGSAKFGLSVVVSIVLYAWSVQSSVRRGDSPQRTVPTTFFPINSTRPQSG